MDSVSLAFRQSYDVDIELSVSGSTSKSCNTLDLKNPFFRYTGQQPQPPPGSDNGASSPSDNYWNQQDATGKCCYAYVSVYVVIADIDEATVQAQKLTCCSEQ